MNNLETMIFTLALLVTLYEVNGRDIATELPALSQDTLEAQYGHIKYAALLFRHGDRTPTKFYPNDPCSNITWPVELGQLTNAGKKREYDLGKYFQPRYNRLTGTQYKPSKVVMQASNKDRCLMSAQLFLAGYFPPSGKQVWNEQLLWQPIPVDTAPSKYDNVIAMRKRCSRRDHAEKQFYETSPFIKEICANFTDMFLYLQNHTGLNLSECTSQTFRKVIDLQDTLLIEEQWNLTLPQWTREVFPEPLTNLRGLFACAEAEDRTVAKLKAGPLLSVIAAEMLNTVKINHTIPEYIYTQKKQHMAPLHLFSGHDGTIVTLLRALNMYNNTNPPYGAAFGLELRSKGKSHHVTAVYENSMHEPLQILKIPGCSGNCSLTDFIDLIRPLMPQNWDSECHTEESIETKLPISSTN